MQSAVFFLIYLSAVCSKYTGFKLCLAILWAHQYFSERNVLFLLDFFWRVAPVNVLLVTLCMDMTIELFVRRSRILIMTDSSSLSFTTVLVNDGSNIQPCGFINLTTGSYDIKIEGYHASGNVQEIVTYRWEDFFFLLWVLSCWMSLQEIFCLCMTRKHRAVVQTLEEHPVLFLSSALLQLLLLTSK